MSCILNFIVVQFIFFFFFFSFLVYVARAFGVLFKNKNKNKKKTFVFKAMDTFCLSFFCFSLQEEVLTLLFTFQDIY